MKVFYVANMRMPTERAEGIQTVKTCEALAKTGVEVELWVPKRRTDIKTDPYEYFGISNNFKIKKIPTLDLVFLGWFGFVIHTLVFGFVCSFKLAPMDEVIIYSRDENILFMLKGLNNRLIWESHRGKDGFIARKVLQRISDLVVITEGLRKKYLSVSPQDLKIHVLPDAVDIDDFEVQVDKLSLREKFGIKEGQKVVAYIGRLEDWKGYKTFLESTKFLPDEVTPLVIGGGADIEQLRKKYPEVIFYGETPYNDLPTNQKVADVLVVPNSGRFELSSHYTSPLKIFAHMTSGVPIVASKLPSIEEVLNVSNAVLVEPDSSEALAKGIKDVLNDSELSDRIAKKAKMDVEKYTWESRADKLVKFIENQ